MFNLKRGISCFTVLKIFTKVINILYLYINNTYAINIYNTNTIHMYNTYIHYVYNTLYNIYKIHIQYI